MSAKRDYYEVLGVSKNVALNEITTELYKNATPPPGTEQQKDESKSEEKPESEPEPESKPSEEESK